MCGVFSHMMLPPGLATCVGGKHNPFDGCKPDEREKLVNVIQTFMDDCVAASQ